MVLLNIKTLALDDQSTHLATDWEVADNSAFHNPVLQSIDDGVNLRSISFNYVPNPNIKYYARARCKLTTGWTIWGNLDIFTPTAINDLYVVDEFPTRVSAPALVSSSSVSNHDITLFNVYATGFGVVGTANHLSTSWFIEDIVTGKVVWKKLEDDIHKTNVLISDIILEENRVYRVKAIFNSNSNDSSQISTRTFKTSSNSLVELSKFLDDVQVGIENTIEIGNILNATSIDWEILQVDNSVLSSIWYKTTVNNTVTIKANTLKPSEMYILRIRDNVSNAWKYYTFSTQAVV